MVKKGVTTYFLAQKSGLFRPGAATILANSPMKKATAKPKLGLRKEGQKKLGQGGGQSGGSTNLAWILALGYWNDGGMWIDSDHWID